MMDATENDTETSRYWENAFEVDKNQEIYFS